ncbi:MAG TPA: hypothetical protein VG276_28870 [Actinomycetes bacterium]|jgi:hypothetical protein|nr:hypothetical protein [Actinomycetes bacterium]
MKAEGQPRGMFATTPVAARTYQCDGYRCGRPILRGERYRQFVVAPWYEHNYGAKTLQPDGSWKDTHWLTYRLHLDPECRA